MDEATQRHIDHVRALSQPGQPLATDSPHATVNNPEWFKRSGGGVLKARGARSRMHSEIRAEHRDRYPDAKNERKAVILAGPPGAGKGSILSSALGAEESTYLRLDADQIKESLLQRALADGSYESTIKPPAIRDLEQQGETFYPLEMASLVHEESSLVTRRLRDSAISEGTNLIVDGVLSNPEGAQRLGAQLAAAGYDITIVDVEVPYEVSEQAIRQRWEEKYTQARAGEDNALGGRWVPSTYAREIFDGPNGRSRPEAVARDLAQNNGSVSDYQLWRRNSATESPRLDTRLSRPYRDGTLMDSEAAGALRPTARTSPTRSRPRSTDLDRPGHGR